MSKCGRSLPAPAARAAKRQFVAEAVKDNLIGVHALVWCGGWSKEEILKAANGSREAGFDLIEIPVFQPEVMDAGLTKAILSDNGLKASASLGLSLDADISSDDSDCVSRGKQKLISALNFTQRAGGTVLCGPIYSAIAKYPGPPTAQGRKNCVLALREVAQRASDVGVTLGLEVINRYETNVLNTASQAMEFLADLNASGVTVHLDTYHMNIEENSMEQAVRTCASALGYVHVGESHRGYLGTGSVDFQGLFHTLAAVEYDGPITFESFSSSVVSPDLSNNLCVWRNLWQESSDLAVHARKYIDAAWTAAKLTNVHK